MTREQKQLVFKDLSARLPHKVRVKVWLKDGTTEEGSLDLQHNYGDVLVDAFYRKVIKKIKPYLRPMSSMTEEEKDKYHSYCKFDDCNFNGEVLYFDTIESFDYLNSIHVDYRGLIPKGLAIEVTKKNNPYKD